MYIPAGIGRLPTRISSHHGAKQWKNWILIYSVVALKGLLPIVIWAAGYSMLMHASFYVNLSKGGYLCSWFSFSFAGSRLEEERKDSEESLVESFPCNNMTITLNTYQSLIPLVKMVDQVLGDILLGGL